MRGSKKQGLWTSLRFWHVLCVTGDSEHRTLEDNYFNSNQSNEKEARTAHFFIALPGNLFVLTRTFAYKLPYGTPKFQELWQLGLFCKAFVLICMVLSSFSIFLHPSLIIVQYFAAEIPTHLIMRCYPGPHWWWYIDLKKAEFWTTACPEDPNKECGQQFQGFMCACVSLPHAVHAYWEPLLISLIWL